MRDVPGGKTMLTVTWGASIRSLQGCSRSNFGNPMGLFDFGVGFVLMSAVGVASFLHAGTTRYDSHFGPPSVATHAPRCEMHARFWNDRVRSMMMRGCVRGIGRCRGQGGAGRVTAITALSINPREPTGQAYRRLLKPNLDNCACSFTSSDEYSQFTFPSIASFRETKWTFTVVQGPRSMD
jgi:hypothetical protein